MTCPPRAVTASSAAHRSSCARRMSVAVASGKPSSSTTSPASTTVSAAGLLGQVPRQRRAGPPGHVGADRRQVQVTDGDHLPAGRDGHLEQVGDLRSRRRAWAVWFPSLLVSTGFLPSARSNDAPARDAAACGATRSRHVYQLDAAGRARRFGSRVTGTGTRPVRPKRISDGSRRGRYLPFYGTRRVRPPGDRGGRPGAVGGPRHLPLRPRRTRGPYSAWTRRRPTYRRRTCTWVTR